MRRFLLFLVVFTAGFSACKSDTQPVVGGRMLSEEDVLVSAKFSDDNTFRIVCKGFPMEGLKGVAAENSAMESARLNAIYFIKRDFDPSVDPGVSGDVEHYEMRDAYAMVHYVVKMKGLKKKYHPGQNNPEKKSYENSEKDAPKQG